MFGTRTRAVDADPVTTSTPVWSPAQLIAVLFGVASIVFGVLALTKTGLDLGHVKTPHDRFAGFHHTPFLGLAEIAFGVLLVLSGLRPVAGRSLMTLLGASAAALGAILVFDFWNATLHEWLGTHDRNGYLFLAVGAVLLAAAFLMPVAGGHSRTVVRERVVDTDAD
jgi:hypothetical protein